MSLGSVMIWQDISQWLLVGLDHHSLHGILSGYLCIGYSLEPVVGQHFGKHPLATKPVNMVANTRFHRSQVITAYIQTEAVTAMARHAYRSEFARVHLGHNWASYTDNGTICTERVSIESRFSTGVPAVVHSTISDVGWKPSSGNNEGLHVSEPLKHWYHLGT